MILGLGMGVDVTLKKRGRSKKTEEWAGPNSKGRSLAAGPTFKPLGYSANVTIAKVGTVPPTPSSYPPPTPTLTPTFNTRPHRSTSLDFTPHMTRE